MKSGQGGSVRPVTEITISTIQPRRGGTLTLEVAPETQITSAVLMGMQTTTHWVDGGLFSMSLVYALHSLGIGTCCLNLCVPASADRKLHRITGIPDSEAAIMMIAAGHLPERLQVAESVRRPVSETLSRRPTRRQP